MNWCGGAKIGTCKTTPTTSTSTSTSTSFPEEVCEGVVDERMRVRGVHGLRIAGMYVCSVCVCDGVHSLNAQLVDWFVWV